MDFMKLDFDLDGDGVADTSAEAYDTNGDGLLDTVLVDVDGDGVIDAVGYDTNGDGNFDSYGVDLDGDGYIDAEFSTDGMDPISYVPDADDTDDSDSDDYDTEDQDDNANDDGTATPGEYDTDGDGKIDVILDDVDGDGVTDVIYEDQDKDGVFDTYTQAEDTDGDGIADTIISHHYTDIDGDGIFDTEDVFKIDGETGEAEQIGTIDLHGDGVNPSNETEPQSETDKSDLVEINPVFYDENDNGVNTRDYPNFDPSSADMDKVVGDPGSDMEHWEYQGNTGRCAQFAQLFVIEELTGQELDIEEFTDISESNGWFSEDSGTTLSNMDKMIQYYGLESEMSSGNDLTDIAEALNDGDKVIVAVDADEYWYGENDGTYTPGDGCNHAIEVIGIDYSDPDNPMVIINDSGNPDGCGDMIPYQAFMDAWEDSNNYMVVVEGN